jgi:putative endopeptidase
VLVTGLTACASNPAPATNAATQEPPAPTVTSATALESGIALENIDEGVRPQDDFYRYVNGLWLERTEIPSDRSNYGAFTELSEQAEEDLKALVEAAAAEDAEPGSDEQKVGALYRSFMDTARIEALGIEPVRSELDRIAAAEDAGELAELWGEMAPVVGLAPFGSYVSIDQRQSDRHITYLSQGGLGLPDRDYYFREGEEFDRVRAAYRDYVATFLGLADHPDPAAAAEAIFELETRLAEGHWTRTENRDRNATYNRMTATEVDELTGSIDLAAYLEGAKLGEADEIVVRQPSYFEALDGIVMATPMDTWKAYMTFHLLDGVASMLSSDFVDAHFDFRGRVLSGIAEPRPRWKRGVDVVGGSVRDVLGRLYVERHFAPEAKARMDELVDNLLAAFEVGIGELDWMSPATQAEARAKLAKFTPKIGYPDVWEDYSGLEITDGDLIENLRRVRAFQYQDNVSKLGEPIDPHEWGMPPYMVNAYYNPTRNEIVFPAAILQPPFFDMEADDAVNYGAIGAVIGHEISHGFDDQGRKSDGDGNLRDWWTPEDAHGFEARADMLVEQYSGYEPLEGLNLNGRLTLGENIGDLSGLAVAYKAYRMSLNGEAHPVIDGYTGDQRFFMGWAQVWRRLYTEPELRNRIMTDPHSPSEYRTNGIVAHMPAFYEAFDVQPGDGMWVAPAQRVRIW